MREDRKWLQRTLDQRLFWVFERDIGDHLVTYARFIDGHAKAEKGRMAALRRTSGWWRPGPELASRFPGRGLHPLTRGSFFGFAEDWGSVERG